MEPEPVHLSSTRSVSPTQQGGIETMLLKGAALLILFYKDAGLRPMTDVDLLVRRDQANRAIQLLTSLGWKSKYSSPEALIPFEQAGEFRNGDNQSLDLHWCLMWEGRQELGRRWILDRKHHNRD